MNLKKRTLTNDTKQQLKSIIDNINTDSSYEVYKDAQYLLAKLKSQNVNMSQTQRLKQKLSDLQKIIDTDLYPDTLDDDFLIKTKPTIFNNIADNIQYLQQEIDDLQRTGFDLSKKQKTQYSIMYFILTKLFKQNIITKEQYEIFQTDTDIMTIVQNAPYYKEPTKVQI